MISGCFAMNLEFKSYRIDYYVLHNSYTLGERSGLGTRTLSFSISAISSSLKWIWEKIGLINC